MPIGFSKISINLQLASRFARPIWPVLNHQIGGACVSTCFASNWQGVSTLGRIHNVNFEHALNVVNKRVQQLRPLLCYALR